MNLVPADLRQEGPPYDLSMARGVLRAGEQVVFEAVDVLFLGELGLDGMLRHSNGMLPMVGVARDHGIHTVFVPAVHASFRWRRWRRWWGPCAARCRSRQRRR